MRGAGLSTAQAKARVSDYQAKIRDFTKQTGLKRDYTRERDILICHQRYREKITIAEMLKQGPSESAQEAFYRKPYSTEKPDVAGILYAREVQGTDTQGL